MQVLGTLQDGSGNNFTKYGGAITLVQLNTVTLEPGFYNLEGIAVSGLPGNYFYIIQTGKYSGGGYRAQLAIPYQDGTNNSLYLRLSVGSTWGSWSKLAKVSDIPTKLSDLLDDIGIAGSVTELSIINQNRKNRMGGM